MKTIHVVENKEFIGRDYERERLLKLIQAEGASIIVIYGRRRVGKTELIEQTLASYQLIKFEGLEGQDTQQQIKHVLYQLAQYTDDPYIAKLKLTRWVEVFELIAKHCAKGHWILYFEEVQWLANYKPLFISELKYVWDNQFRHNPQLKIILCGSAPSFMIKKVIHSKALYNRSLNELHLKEFSIKETKAFLPKHSLRDVMQAYLTIGGIPEYLKKVRNATSIFLGICNESFIENSFFSNEYERIFISSLSNSSHYKEIVEYLSQKRFATRAEIANQLKISSGGRLSDLLNDLELCGFIERYTPFQANDATLLSRYCVNDSYLRFYYKFIKPIKKNIKNGNYNKNPVTAINTESYQQWLGYAFEYFCRKQNKLIAKILEFSGIRYQSGSFYNRKTEKAEPGYQIDLIFERADNVYTICEIKYLRKKVDTQIIETFEKKLERFPNKKKFTIQKVLISCEGATEALHNEGYFDRIITLEDLFA